MTNLFKIILQNSLVVNYTEKSYNPDYTQKNYEISDALKQREEINSGSGSNSYFPGILQKNKSNNYSIENGSSANIDSFTNKANRYGLIEYLSFIWLLGSMSYQISQYCRYNPYANQV